MIYPTIDYWLLSVQYDEYEEEYVNFRIYDVDDKTDQRFYDVSRSMMFALLEGGAKIGYIFHLNSDSEGNCEYLARLAVYHNEKIDKTILYSTFEEPRFDFFDRFDEKIQMPFED